MTYLECSFDDVALVKPEVLVSEDQPVGSIQLIHGLLSLGGWVPDVGCWEMIVIAAAEAAAVQPTASKPAAAACMLAVND